MHICLFVRPSTVEELADLADLTGRRPVVAAVAAPASLLEAADPEVVERLAGSDIEWVRSARTAPALTLLPNDFLQSALAVESDRYQELGLHGDALYFEGPPNTGLPRIAAEGDISCLITRSRNAIAGVLVDLDMVIPCFGTAPVIDTSRTGDELQLWETVVADVETRIDEITALEGCDLSAPTRFLEEHTVTGAFPVRDLSFEPDPLLARKLVRIATRLPRRPGAEVVNLILEAASVEHLSSEAGAERHAGVHSALIAARAAIDNSRRRADDWARVTRLDWDADGREEVQVELRTSSFVIDPTAGGAVLVFDDKTEGTTLAWLESEPPGLLLHMHDGEDVPETIELAVEGIEESREGVTLTLGDESGWVRVVVGLSDRAMNLEYHLTGAAERRLGPELPLLLGDTRLRVDGGEWLTVDQPIAVSGHRFRLEGSVRDALITSMLPTDLFVRPSDGGVVIWPNWYAAAPGALPIRIDLRRPR
ncbi:MAG: hypothetical protein OEQ47_04705 [Acidimicrobiia bacterium]|nr:hypothetical protein [Acidimicrobiia bacterium]